jgi:hypothetical protein
MDPELVMLGKALPGRLNRALEGQRGQTSRSGSRPSTKPSSSRGCTSWPTCWPPLSCSRR